MKREEKLLRAIGGVDDELIADAMEPRNKKQPAWLRWTAAAACLCLLLASPVGANVIGGIIEEDFTYRAPDRHPVAVFSQEALDLAAGQNGSIHIPMDSMEDAVRFLGLNHIDNPILDNAVPKEVRTTTAKGEVFGTAFLVWMDAKDGAIRFADAQGHYTIDLASVDVQYVLITDQITKDSGVAIDPDDMEAREDYVTPRGLECVLYTHIGYQDWGTADCTAFAAKGDCLIWVTVSHHDPDTAMRTLKQIMDAYE